ncbi:MAG: penicillin-binding protein 2, partial [Chromatiales bacterium]|nr:penicillin-binding protein 2 [Chromatiales bacterium]
MWLINAPPPVAIKDLVVEQFVFRGRVVAVGLFVGVLFMVLFVRMVQLQVVDHEHFRTLSENNRVKILPIEPTRGLIYDREGVLLAQNTPSYSLEVVPESVENLDALLADLRRHISISESDEARFRQRFEAALVRRRPFDAIPLRLRLSDDEVSRFAVNLYRFPGVSVNARLSRHYPLGSLMAHVVGYMARINEQDLLSIDEAHYRASTHIGRTGVERAYEELLHGEVGYQHVETNAHNRVLRVLPGRQEAAAGNDLHLSVDASLQAAAEAALGDENGTVVALNPSTGGVLAMVS